MLKQFDVKSIMYVGVTVGNELLGAFALSTTRQTRRWSEDRHRDRQVGGRPDRHRDSAGEALSKAEATSAREALVNKLGGAIRSSLSLPEVLETTVRELGKALVGFAGPGAALRWSERRLVCKNRICRGGRRQRGRLRRLLRPVAARSFPATHSNPLVISDLQEFQQ